jgi:hypothetical protein
VARRLPGERVRARYDAGMCKKLLILAALVALGFVVARRLSSD